MVAVDGTSISTYSKKSLYVEYDHNKDVNKIKQTNMMFCHDLDNNITLFY